MLNEKGIRELAYIVKIDGVTPIKGADRVELAIVGGWHVMVRKNQFKQGDLGIYIEIDSRVPEQEPFMFLEDKHFKVKTQKYFKGTVISQGLLMSLEDFPKMFERTSGDRWKYISTGNLVSEKDFLTKELKIVYSSDADNERKGSGPDKYVKMRQRRPDVFKKKWAKYLMKKEWGRRLLFVFFGKKRDNSKWPSWVVKTDEERIQNMAWILKNKNPWFATEKIDGTSTTFTLKRGNLFKEEEFYVCSRNVPFLEENQKCFYERNVYTEIAERYHMREVLQEIIQEYDLEWATLQGETYGAGVQIRNYGLSDIDFAGFNLIFSDRGRLNPRESMEIMSAYGINWVPILDEEFILPDTVEELLEIATGKSEIDGGMREGIVFRSQDGQQSFKAVSNEFLMTYHNN